MINEAGAAVVHHNQLHDAVVYNVMRCWILIGHFSKFGV